MEIVIVTDCADARGSVIRKIAVTVPNTITLNLHGLEVLLEALKDANGRKAEVLNRQSRPRDPFRKEEQK